MLEKAQKLLNTPLVQQFRDIRVVSFWVFAVIIVLVSWSGVQVIQSNIELQRKIARLEQQNEVSRLENENQKLRNEYYKSDQYLEITARRQFNKGFEGETLLLVPREVAAKYITPTVTTKPAAKEVARKPAYQRNLEAWIDFFLHRDRRS